MTDYKFTVTCITDSGTNFERVWTQDYNNAIDAAKSYLSFVDHGTCMLERVVTLFEPNGKTHTKVFKYPYGSEEKYQAASNKARGKANLVSNNG